MADRGFNEIELREMLRSAKGYRPDIVLGRWTIETRRRQALWEVIVEPDVAEQVLAVVTAYHVE